MDQKSPFEEAYRRFKRQCDRNLIVTEARARQHYEPPTERRKGGRLLLVKRFLKKGSTCFENMKQGL